MNKKDIINKLKTLPPGWNDLLKDEIEEPYYQELIEKVAERYLNKIVYPPIENVFDAFKYTSLEKLKVVIIGQDPYFNPEQANGLAFSVNPGVKFPPSLKNIFKELNYEYGYPIPEVNGSLVPWAKQGVLLLNASMTVEEGVPNSHAKLGWQKFTNRVIAAIDSNLWQPIVYLLWGRYAQEKKFIIRNAKVTTIETSHPSPLSVAQGFYKSNCFKKANEYLVNHKAEPIDWQIKDITLF